MLLKNLKKFNIDAHYILVKGLVFGSSNQRLPLLEKEIVKK